MEKSIVSKAVWVIVCGLISLQVGEARARMTGTDIDTCNGCHEHGEPPQAMVTADNHQLQPGGTANFVLSVSSTNNVSGFLVKAPPVGELHIADESKQRYHEEPGIITHVMPQPFENGMATWEFSYTAPMEVGVTVLKVSTVAANGNQMPGDDGAALLQTWVAHGCEGQEYFPDLDEDGYGDGERTSKPSCEPVPNHVPNALDCADNDPMRNPDMPELCNAIDDNCDGTADEGLNTSVLYPDADGDGFGTISDGESILDCPPIMGYADNFDDCNDSDPMVNPGMEEVCNGLDDNCDRRVDNITCGLGVCQVEVAGCDMMCEPLPPMGEEICGNEEDEDCDGVLDNGCDVAAAGGAGGAASAAGGMAGAPTAVAAGGGPVVNPVQEPSGLGGCSLSAARSTPVGYWLLAGLALGSMLRRRRS